MANRNTQQKRPLSDDDPDDEPDDEPEDDEDESHGAIFSRMNRTLGRLSLEDNGERDWHEESIKNLELNCPDWKDLSRTVMVPHAFPVPLHEASTGDVTEKKVYDILEEFGKAYQEPMFVVHSHNFADLITEKKKGFKDRTKKWIKGEHDFVIIHRVYGFIFLQVKSSKTTGEAFKKAKYQIKKDIKSIGNFLDNCFETKPPDDSLQNALYNYPGFVVMPNCQPKNPNDDGVFMNDCKNKESFKAWWDDKVVTDNKRVMDEVYKALVIRFVALSHISMCSQIDETHKQIVHFHTSEQLEYLLTASAEQWWAGPAGSGKTVLLKTKVKELAGEIVEKKRFNEKILVLCYNKPLSVHLKKNFKDWFYKRFPGSRLKSPVHVYTYHSFIYKIFTDTLGLTDNPKLYEGEKFEARKRIVEEYFLTHSSDESYQHIFVDEGQDFPGNECLNLLRKVHNKPNREDTSDCRYYFWVFFDSNQHVQLRENESSLWESNSNKFRLTKVLRNTENVFLLAKTCYSGVYSGDEISLGHNEVGMNVVYDDCLELTTDRSSDVQILVRHIRKLQQNKVKLEDIVILVRTKDSRDQLMEFLKKEKPPIRCFNAEYHDSNKAVRPLHFVVVDSIRRFKGLESKVVILYDPPYLLDRNNVETPALLYTAISRCFCYLVVVSTQEGCKAIKKRVDDIKYRKKVAGTGVNTDWN